MAKGVAVHIDVFNMMGAHLLHQETYDSHLTFDVLIGSRVGIYLVRFTQNKQVRYKRVVNR